MASAAAASPRAAAQLAGCRQPRAADYGCRQCKIRHTANDGWLCWLQPAAGCPLVAVARPHCRLWRGRVPPSAAC
eukprot:12823915-Alexandrium_andersonii.AAC.1